ncbi:MAG: DUF3996 domain-containing protein [Spirochaetaceae bacterium]|jgi:hypothetical protein|nr:DUF3996 domain-containing protein [Spirochaetaceae bacterium]
MLKRMVFVVMLGVALTTTAVFAQHPRGKTGIGIVGQYGGNWDGGGHGFNHLALSLKLSSIPIYWGVNLNIFNDDWLGFGITGDKYFIDQALVPDIGLGWYLGVGGYGSFTLYTGNAYNAMWLGAGIRVPIGLSFVIPSTPVEIFLDIAPSIGLGVGFGDYYGSGAGQHKPIWLDGGWGGDLGIRFWF